MVKAPRDGRLAQLEDSGFTAGMLLSMTSTTIKVPVTLRDRVQRHAQREHVSQAHVLEHALDLLDREAFFSQLRRDVVDRPENPAERHEREDWLGGPVAVDRDETQG